MQSSSLGADMKVSLAYLQMQEKDSMVPRYTVSRLNAEEGGTE